MDGSSHGFNARRQSDDHGQRCQSYRGGECQAGNGNWFLGLFPCWFAHYAGDSGCGMGVADLDSLRATGFQNFVCIGPNSGDNRAVDRYSILDPNSSGATPGVPPPVLNTTHEPASPIQSLRLSPDDSGKSLTEMAQRDLE